MHLVIGASGFAGQHAVTALREQVAVRTAEVSEDLSLAMDGVDVVHMAFPVRSPFRRARFRGDPHPYLASVVDEARRAGVRRIVHLSSAAVYGFTPEGRASERTMPRPEHPYERLLAWDEEWLRRQLGVEVVCLRPAQLFGPGEPLLSCLVDRVLGGHLMPIPGGGAARRTFLSGPDLGRAFAAAGLRGEPGMAYLVGGITASWRELMQATGRALSLRVFQAWLPYDLAYLSTAARRLGLRFEQGCWPTTYLVDLFARAQVVDDGWSRRELGWQPDATTLAEGLAGLADWYRDRVTAERAPSVLGPANLA